MPTKPLFQKILPRGQFLTFEEKPELSLVRTHQVHSTEIATYEGADLSENKSDGVLFKFSTLLDKKVSVAITTADCMPVIFLGKEEGVFLHAGWKGLADGILKNEIIKKIKPYYAFIGPSIKLEAFEVQKDFKDHFIEEEFFHTINDSLHFDLLAKATKEILLTYKDIQLETTPLCTFSNPKFHSYRRDKTIQRNWNIFTL